VPAFFVGVAPSAGREVLAQAWPMLLAANLGGTLAVGLAVEHGRRWVGLYEDLRTRRTQAEKLASVASETTNAVIITDAAGYTEWVNAAFERLTGYSPSEVSGRIPGHFLQGPDSDPAVIETMRNAVAKGEGFQVEVVNYHKNGTPYFVAIDCQPLYERGRLVRFVAIQTDVTERKSLQQRLLRAEQVGNMGHWTLDPRTGAVIWSAETFRIFGLDPAAPIPTLDDLIQRFHPDDRAEVRRIVDHAIAHGAPFAFRKRLQVGDRIKWVDVRAECERAAGGGASSVFGVIHDTTHLVEAVERAQAREAQLRTLMDSIPAAIGYLDTAGRYSYANKVLNEQFGPADDGPIGAPWTRFWDGQPPARAQQAVQAALAGERLAFQLDWTDPQGDTHQFSVTLVPDLSAEGTVRGVFSIAFDVTDYRRREQELRRARDEATAASRVKSEFLATMSHELRTPLNAISGYAEVMAQELFGALGNPRYRNYAGDILSSAVYLRELIEGVLELSSIEAGGTNLELSAQDLGALAGEAYALVQTSAKRKGVALQCDLGAALPACVDRRALKQVLINCLENGIKFTPAGGEVRLSGTLDTAWVRLTVADTGHGIPSDKLALVTQPFYRAQAGDRADVAAERGTGIGLALVQRYVRLMDGELEIDSVEGEGTAVTIRLPRAEVAPAPPEAETPCKVATN
jgi:PAS domain S-box-containing protein